MWHEYPYTDAHELNLDWFLARFKEYYEHITEQDRKITTMEETVEQFTSFVTNYFDNLDVQQEINNKLDAMAASGELQAMLQPYFDGFVEAVNDQLTTQNHRIDALDGRMDTFTHLTDGSTAGDAELADIRVGYDGTVYPNAGDAVRGQVSDLEDEIESINNLGYIDRHIKTETGYIDGTGADSYNTNVQYRRTQYIKVSELNSIVVTIIAGVSAIVYALYDATKTVIGSRTSIAGGSIPFGSAAYVRIAAYNSTNLSEALFLSALNVVYKNSVIQDLQNNVNQISSGLSYDSIISSFYQGGFVGTSIGNYVTQLTFDTAATRIRSINANTGVNDTFRIPANTKVRMSVDEGYNYLYQVYSMSTGQALDDTDYTTDDIILNKTEDVGFIVKIGRIDGGNITPADGVHFKLEIWSDIKDHVNNIGEAVDALSDDQLLDDIPSFHNNFIPTSLMTLPSVFSSFPIDVSISKYGNSYGYMINDDFFRRSSDNVTYYVSVDGDDTAAGTTPETALLTIDEAVSKSDVGTIIILPGKYVKGVHFTSTPITKSLNIMGVGIVILDTPKDESPLVIQSSCYIRNITFLHGNSNVHCELESDLCIFDECRFVDSFSVNGLDIYGGNIILRKCVVKGAARDGFFYKKNGTYYPQVLEVECAGYDCGNNYNSFTNNCSTAHDSGTHIIRIGCAYHTSKGTPLADADACFSLNIDCSVYSSIAIGSADRNGNFGAFGASMWLYNCKSNGSTYDIISDLSGVINTDITYPAELAQNGGTINHI